MARYLLTRLIQAAIVVYVVLTVTFVLIAVAPGGLGGLQDPSIAAEDAARIRTKLGLDEPPLVQYLDWMGNAAHLDLGTSIRFHQPVTKVVLDHAPATLLLGAVSIVLSVVIAVPLGVLAAIHHGSWVDRLSTFIALFGLSVPAFWLGIIAILVFSATLRVLPSSGMITLGAEYDPLDIPKHLVMPVVVLSLLTLAGIMRYTRSTMLTVLDAEFLRTARAKGLRERQVIVGHALKNGLIPIVTVIGLMLPRLVGGTVVVETIFSWPGMGRLAVDAATQNDYPLVLGVTLLVSVVVVLANILVDVLYVYLDPRIRLTA